MSERMEFRDSREKQVEQILKRFGHLKQGGGISQELKQDIARGVIDSDDLEAICSELEKAKGEDFAGSRGLDTKTFQYALQYGLRNLSGLRFHREIENKDLSGFNLSAANLRGASFVECDFGNANLEGFHFDLPAKDLQSPIKESAVNQSVTNFRGSRLNNIQLSSISIGEETIDLTEGAIEVDGKYWDIHENGGWVGSCGGAEFYYRGLLGMPDKRIALIPEYPKYANRGVVLFQNGEPLGIFKLKGEHSFLPFRTVRDEKGQVIFWKGMIYALDNPLYDILYDKSLSHKEETQWRRADIETIAEITPGPYKIDNRRFIFDPSVYSRLMEVMEAIRSGKEHLVDITSGKLA